jgi:hypothetical protein
MKGWITVNTDAGFLPDFKVGSYAYWIKGDDMFYRGSGIFKNYCTNSVDCEVKAMMNALHIIIASGRTDIVKIIFNRDAVGARAKKEGHPNQVMFYNMLDDLKERCGKEWDDNFCEFRHVKGHTKNPKKARNWVNNYLDAECTKELKKYRKQLEDDRNRSGASLERIKMGKV